MDRRIYLKDMTDLSLAGLKLCCKLYVTNQPPPPQKPCDTVRFDLVFLTVAADQKRWLRFFCFPPEQGVREGPLTRSPRRSGNGAVETNKSFLETVNEKRDFKKSLKSSRSRTGKTNIDGLTAATVSD